MWRMLLPCGKLIGLLLFCLLFLISILFSNPNIRIISILFSNPNIRTLDTLKD